VRRALALGLSAVALMAVAAPAKAADPPLVVRTSLAPTIRFGDTTSMRVTVLADPHAVDLGTIRITAPVVPFAQLSPASVSRTHQGPADVMTYELTVACLDQRCVAPKGARTLRLPLARATASGRDGQTVTATSDWPAVTVGGRVPTGVTASAGAFRTDLDPPPATYRISPGPLTALIVLAAVFLAAVVAGLAAVRTARLVRRRRETHLTDLERALALARQAESRSPSDRRRAVGLLARVLGGREPRLADQASTLAWSRPDPSSPSVAAIVDDIDHAVGAQ
jgi:hypothetical protein